MFVLYTQLQMLGYFFAKMMHSRWWYYLRSLKQFLAQLSVFFFVFNVVFIDAKNVSKQQIQLFLFGTNGWSCSNWLDV